MFKAKINTFSLLNGALNIRYFDLTFFSCETKCKNPEEDESFYGVVFESVHRIGHLGFGHTALSWLKSIKSNKSIS